MVYVVLSGYFHGSVRTAVVDDQGLDAIDPIDLFRQVSQGDGKRVFFIQARDLYD